MIAAATSSTANSFGNRPATIAKVPAQLVGAGSILIRAPPTSVAPYLAAESAISNRVTAGIPWMVG